jgi:hypothetical protein
MGGGASHTKELMYLPLSDDDKRSVRLADIRIDLSDRLLFVSKHMSSSAYDAMVDDIAVLQYKSEIALRNGH